MMEPVQTKIETGAEGAEAGRPPRAETREAEPRAAWMSLLAQADPSALAAALDGLGPRPDFAWLRAPQRGAVMVRGRLGGTGAPFNLGEMTVTRCTLQLAGGEVGHAWTPGRDADHARDAALADALMQTDAADRVEAELLAPLRAAAAAKAEATAGKAEATRVNFFTMARGED